MLKFKIQLACLIVIVYYVLFDLIFQYYPFVTLILFTVLMICSVTVMFVTPLHHV